jgi:extracellular elastinolytic metalloproteinase
MGEGWSDYIPCTIHQTTIVGDWVANRPHGIRGYPYDSNFPDHFGKIGQGRYTEEHTIGEIWCATLLEMNRKIGVNLALHLVVDALKLSPANPSFLDMRDAILSALDNKLAAQQLTPAEHKAARRGIWEVMAKFGLGPQASSNGASLAGIVADFGLPPEDAGEVLRLAAAPDLAIPDNQPAGVNSTVAVNQSGRVVSLKVTVDIAHPYIGDLRVRLLTPGGATAMLHDRTGARTKNLAKTYSDQDTPALSGLVGQEAQGNWVLEVADLAKIDTGRLKKWRLELALEAGPQVVQGEATPAVKIPDDNPAGVSSVIAIGLEGKARKLKVSVDITHAWIGDLKVELTSPGGQHAILHDQSGGSQDNLVTTYESMPGSPLLTFINQPIFGNWVLRASDLQGQDEGKLNRWSLEITC